MEEAERMTKTEEKPLEAEHASTEEDLRSTSAALQERDKRLREALDGRFDDDGSYFALTAQIGELAAKAHNNLIEGYERARATGLLAKIFSQLAKTKRFRAEQDFNEVSRKRESAESQVRALEKIKKRAGWPP